VKYFYETVTIFQATITLCNSCRANTLCTVRYPKINASTCSDRSRVPDYRPGVKANCTDRSRGLLSGYLR